MAPNVICTLYSPLADLDKIRTVLTTCLPKAKMYSEKQDENTILRLEIKDGFFSATKKLRLTYRERAIPATELPMVSDDPLCQNLSGMYNFVRSLPAKNTYVRDQLLQKIETLNSECSVIQEGGEIKDLALLILAIAANMNAVVFAQPDTAISKVPEQHFLDSKLNLIIDMQGNCGIDGLPVTGTDGYFRDHFVALTKDQEERKARSEKILEEFGVKINRHLPCVESEEDTTIRSATEIAQRVVILDRLAQVAFGNLAPKEAFDMLFAHQLWDLTTPMEKAFLVDPTEDDKFRMSWRVECIWMLMWALGAAEEIGSPAEPASLDNLDATAYPVPGRDPNEFIGAAKVMRSKAEILDVSDLYYRLDWARADAHLAGRKAPNLDGSVVYERHYAVNWLTNYMDQEWDDITCDT